MSEALASVNLLHFAKLPENRCRYYVYWHIRTEGPLPAVPFSVKPYGIDGT